MAIEICAICIEKIDDNSNTHVTECNHMFHSNCFASLEKLICPCCRGNVRANMEMSLNIANKELLIELDNYEQLRQQFSYSHLNAKIKLDNAEEKLRRYKHPITLFGSMFFDAELYEINDEYNRTKQKHFDTLIIMKYADDTHDEKKKHLIQLINQLERKIKFRKYK